jgi:hypothetical protein
MASTSSKGGRFKPFSLEGHAADITISKSVETF